MVIGACFLIMKMEDTRIMELTLKTMIGPAQSWLTGAYRDKSELLGSDVDTSDYSNTTIIVSLSVIIIFI
jgi:hypothetical protein